ncbi:MAG TPA: alternative ribosome rescue aminoacyl-tRNA hydrolase ArfB, partial [Gemmatimonadaceae bacterium]
MSTDSIQVDDFHAIPRDEVELRATRSGGPGGQHVNVTSTRVEVRWNPSRSRALTPAEKERVTMRLASRLDGSGWVRVAASDTRSQRQNRILAEQRLAGLVARALLVPKKRVATKPSGAAREKRLRVKKLRGQRKRERRGDD